MAGAWPSSAAHINGGGSAQGFLRVHVRAMVEQHLHRIDIAGARRHHERSPSQRELLVGIGSGVDQRLDDRRHLR